MFARIDGHDSGCTSYGVGVGDERWFVKVAFGPDVGQLRSAEAVHRRLRHPAVVPLVAAVQVGANGRAVVYPWRNGSILNDPFAGNGGDPHAPGRPWTGSAGCRHRRSCERSTRSSTRT